MELEPDVELCTRWGEGRDRCIRHFDHDGDCQDRKGNTTTSMLKELKGEE